MTGDLRARVAARSTPTPSTPRTSRCCRTWSLAAVNEALRQADGAAASKATRRAGGLRPDGGARRARLAAASAASAAAAAWRRRRRHAGRRRPNRAARRAQEVGGLLAPPLQRLVTELAKLPGIGNRTAQRLAFHVLRASPEDAFALADAIREVKERITLCEVCFNLAEGPRCTICLDERRDAELICVVEEPGDVIPIERTHEFRGRYHVLGGALSPIDGVEPEDLRLAQLYARVATAPTPSREVVLATNPTTTGEATALHIADGLHERAPGRHGHPAGLRACRSAATSSTPTRSRSAGRSPAGGRSSQGAAVPCKVYLRADDTAIFCNDAADVVVRRIEEAADGERFIQVALTPNGRGDTPRTAYISPTDITAVLPIPPQEYEHLLDDPPEWFSA